MSIIDQGTIEPTFNPVFTQFTLEIKIKVNLTFSEKTHRAHQLRRKKQQPTIINAVYSPMVAETLLEQALCTHNHRFYWILSLISITKS